MKNCKTLSHNSKCPIELIRDYQEKWSEWLEMAENPDEFMNVILAQQIVALTSRVEYLERLRDG